MATITLGVIDIPYVGFDPNGKKKRVKVAIGTETTGDVAEWLENKYHVIETFFELRREKFEEQVLEAIEASIEDLVTGASVSKNPFSDALHWLDDQFKAFLTSREIEGLGIPGVPTKAAIKGVNTRKKLFKGPRRPSFIDTGQYEASFKAWVTE